MTEELPVAQLVDLVVRLRARAADDAFGSSVLDEALTSLEQSIEELQVASEELQVKNEELLLAMTDLDVERRRYRDLFDLAADGYLVTDADDVVVEANRAAGQLTGRPAESLIGCRLLDLLSRGSRAESARRVRQARAGREGETVLELAAGDESRLVHVRYRRRPDTRAGEPRTHWALTDLERPILESEEVVQNDARMARRWLRIYGELVEVTESLLDGAMGRVEGLSRPARGMVVEAQVRPLEAHLAGLRRRRDHWSRRYGEMVGLELSPDLGEVRYGDRVVPMTRREQQLLRFLMDRPGSFFPSRVLLTRAWHASYLSEEQVRTYVGRLRRKLDQLGLPCELVTRRPQGYALVFAEGDGGPPSPSPV